jgi:hypothetical protein
MEELNHRKTPLGDTFNDTDFPLEAHAWHDMEKLLAAQKPKPHPLSIGGKNTLFLAGLLVVGLFCFIVLRKDKTPETAQKTDISLKNKGQTLDLRTDMKNNTPSVFTIKNILQSDIYNQSIGDNAPIKQTLSPIFEIKNEDNIDLLQNKNGVNTDLVTPLNITEKTSTIKASNTEKESQLPPQYQSIGEKVLPILDANISDKNLVKNNDLVVVQLTENDKNGDKNIPSAFYVEKAIGNVNISKNIDNQYIINQNTYANAVEPLDFSALENVYSTAMAAERDAQVLQNLSSKSLIPLRKLLTKPRHQLEVGAGTATYNAPKTINHFRLGYQYRLTPLFGMGLSGNYSVKVNSNDDPGFTLTTNIEGLLYFVNKRKFDFIVSAGYGYRRTNFDDGFKEKGKGFALGLVGQYRPSEHWVIGLRTEFREIAQGYNDATFLVSFGRRF